MTLAGLISAAAVVPRRAGEVAVAKTGEALDRLNPGRRRRRAWSCKERAHIEVRGVDRPENDALRVQVERALERVRGVRWARVNPVLGRVVVALDEDGPSLDDLLGVVAAVERARHIEREPFPLDRPEHPCDVEPIRRHAIALGADALALGGVAFGRLLQLSPVPTELAALVSIVDNEPRLRQFLEHHLGRAPTDLGLGVASAAAQSLTQGPLALVTDMTHRANLLAETVARRRAWERNESALHAVPGEEDVEPVPSQPRPVPLRPGPVEEFGDRAALGALAAGAAALALTASPRRAAAMLAAGVPKAARQGRDAFAAHLGRELARRDIVVTDESVLRRIDRIDAVVLDSRLVLTGRVEPGASVVVDTGEGRTAGTQRLDPANATSRMRRMVDPAHPDRVTRRGQWAFGPLTALSSAGVTLPRGAATTSRALGRGGRDVAGLAHRGRVVALAPLEPVVEPLAPELVSCAEEGGLVVLLAGGSQALAESVGALGRVPGGRRFRASVRQLQRDGSGVLVVAGGDEQAALAAADCGVGVAVRGEPPAWGADMLVGPGLLQAHLVVASVVVARRVSARSALLALAGSAAGAAVSVTGLAASAGIRAALPVNVAALASQANGVASAAALARRPPPVSRPQAAWHAIDADAVLEALHTSERGLTAEEADRRRVRHRPSEPSGVVKAARAIGSELANPLTPVLAAGAGLSVAVGSVSDAGLVAGVTIVNALIGAAQRLQADVSIAKLARVSGAVVEAIRAGERVPVSRQDLVPGDVIELHAGDVVPADCRILMATSCEVDESALTGESLPVPKDAAPTPGAAISDRRCMLYEGTTISTGCALAVVVAVGEATEVGRTLADAPEPPPSGVESRLGRLTAVTLPATVASGAAVGALGVLRGRTPRQAVTSGVALTVAAVPEGLPLLATAAQQAAARRLASRQALVRNPRTIEALGRVDTLCFDKTGTLTVGEISLQRVSDGRADEPPDALSPRTRAVLAAALRASPDTSGDGVDALPHPTDRAVVVGAQEAGVTAADGVGEWAVIGELPFDPARGFHAVVGRTPGGARISVKGAPEVILPRCDAWCDVDGRVPMDRRVRRRLDTVVEDLAARGLRVLAVAERPASGRAQIDEERVAGMELLGFVALADSVRPSAASAVGELREAGVDVVMITGDHPATAQAVAKDLGILNGHRVVTGAELDALDDGQLADMLPDVSVFARVTPKDKVRIVRGYQRAGRIVAMTGDGANDAPAIRLAHTGIALGSRGSPAAREAADLVVVDDRMETILDAIVEGRSMWVSVRDALAILVGGNLGEVGFALATTAIGGASPLGARQFLLVNLLTDMVPAMTIAVRPPATATPEVLLREGPDKSLGDALVGQIALRAAATGAAATTAWMLARVTGRRRRASTVALAALVGSQLGQTALVGRDSPLVLASTAVSAAVLAGIVQTPGVSQFFGCTPLGPLGWSIAAGSATAFTGVAALVPWVLERQADGSHSDGRPVPRRGDP